MLEISEQHERPFPIRKSYRDVLDTDGKFVGMLCNLAVMVMDHI